MTPRTQLFRTDLAKGIKGDCLRAAVASILDLELAAVPHFGSDYPDGAKMERRLRLFLMSRGLIPIRLAADGARGLEPTLAYVESLNPGVHFLVAGLTPAGLPHVVVACNGKVVWDSNPDKPGLAGPKPNGWYDIIFIGAAVAAAALKEPDL